MAKRQRYPKHWSDVPSVTEVLSIVASPGLINWLKYNDYKTIKETQEKAFDIGKTAHKIIEEIEKGSPISITTKHPQEVRNVVDSYFDWKRDKNIKDIDSEIKLKSEYLGLKGTIDRVCNLNGKLVIIDWKSSKRIYHEQLLQVCAYKRLYDCSVTHAGTIDECWIIRLGKDKPEFEPYKIPNAQVEDLQRMFFSLLKIYNWMKTQINTKEITRHASLQS